MIGVECAKTILYAVRRHVDMEIIKPMYERDCTFHLLVGETSGNDTRGRVTKHNRDIVYINDTLFDRNTGSDRTSLL